MTGPMISCPFRLCQTRVALLIMQKDAGDDETTEEMIPSHRCGGEGLALGTCPASLLRHPLDAYSATALEEQAQSFARWNRERIMGTTDPRDKPARTPRPRRGPTHDFERQGYAGAPKRPSAGPSINRAGFAGRGVVPLGEGPMAGPGAGRPGRPSPEETSFVIPPPKPTTVPTTGRETTAMDDDLRSQLRSLTALAIEGFGQEQEHCSVITAAIEAVEETLESLRDKQEATHQLAIAAVGGGGDVPQPAAQMIGASASVLDTVNEIRGELSLIKSRVDDAHHQAGAAATNGTDYLAVI